MDLSHKIKAVGRKIFTGRLKSTLPSSSKSTIVSSICRDHPANNSVSLSYELPTLAIHYILISKHLYKYHFEVSGKKKKKKHNLSELVCYSCNWYKDPSMLLLVVCYTSTR